LGGIWLFSSIATPVNPSFCDKEILHGVARKGRH
jgi:hypothetical protein